MFELVFDDVHGSENRFHRTKSDISSNLIYYIKFEQTESHKIGYSIWLTFHLNSHKLYVLAYKSF